MADEKNKETKNFRPIKDLFTEKLAEGSILELKRTGHEGDPLGDLAYLHRSGNNNLELSFHDPFYKLWHEGISGAALIATIWPTGDLVTPRGGVEKGFYETYRVVEAR